MNPLGLSPGAIAFDLDPYWNNSLGQELADPTVVGKSHYEQVSVRALQALNNADQMLQVIKRLADDIDDAPLPPGKGVGLRNTRERLQVLYGEASGFAVHNRERGIEVTLRLPFETSQTLGD
mgnify:CR=1 FL=1